LSQEEEAEEPPPFEVWPENENAVNMFLKASTQWRVGPGGITGLDYNVLFRLFSLYGIKDKRGTLEGVQVMENTALKLIAENMAHGNN